MTTSTFRPAIHLTIALVAVAYWTTACATKTQTGALAGGGFGALAGAGIGALAGGKKGAVVGGVAGTAVGATTGALIGSYMDKTEADLRKLQSVKVVRQGDQVYATFASAILFDTNKADLKPQSRNDLADFAKVMRDQNMTNLVVEGQTDSTGKRAHNEKLSAARAESVIAFLQGNGVDRGRLTGKGFADTRPVADNSSSSGREQNRRVQIAISANEKLQEEDARASAQAKGK